MEVIDIEVMIEGMGMNEARENTRTKGRIGAGIHIYFISAENYFFYFPLMFIGELLNFFFLHYDYLIVFILQINGFTDISILRI